MHTAPTIKSKSTCVSLSIVEEEEVMDDNSAFSTWVRVFVSNPASFNSGSMIMFCILGRRDYDC